MDAKTFSSGRLWYCQNLHGFCEVVHFLVFYLYRQKLVLTGQKLHSSSICQRIKQVEFQAFQASAQSLGESKGKVRTQEYPYAAHGRRGGWTLSNQNVLACAVLVTWGRVLEKTALLFLK